MLMCVKANFSMCVKASYLLLYNGITVINHADVC